MSRKFVVFCRAICITCETSKASRVAESWAKMHAKTNPLHRIYLEKAWQIDAPFKMRATTKVGGPT